MFRFLAFLAFFDFQAAHAQAQDTWYGRYEFMTRGMNVTATRSWVYQDMLDIRPNGDKILAVYNGAENADGFDHLAQRWIGQKRAHEILFTFDRCLPRSTLAAGDLYKVPDTSDDEPSDEDCVDQYLRGTPMLTLVEKRGKDGKRVVLTSFHAFKPYFGKVPVRPIRYFQKLEPR